ncbi:MAG TPA: trypsin-like peptidase domain-containing protein [Ginsengibacter sp.]|mgnify:CR=1 FL=1|nr:trypsin-like peptidase domain-containing protein [Ginsengibacter sp.]
MKAKSVFLTVLISAVTTVAVLFGYNKVKEVTGSASIEKFQVPANYAGFFDSNGNYAGPSDFVQAAKAAIPTVVHIKTKSTKTVSNNLPRSRDPFSDMFGDDFLDQFLGRGDRQQRVIPQSASGSGVIISADGYIVTNNHVVSGANEVTVTTSDNKTYTAKVIASDPNYDLAVVKIDGKNLPFMLYGSSANVEIGQWVLAIGYPLTLDATVTAGIISAKSRTLGLNRGKDGRRDFAVESYLQTDAAVNMGNSGGALINTNGQLIGINSAIASPTGYYSGYSYAIPVDIVKKVVADLIKYGSVQRAFLGVRFIDAGTLTKEEKASEKIPESADGIFAKEVVKDGAAAAAGLKEGDIIRKVNGISVNSSAELQEQISHYRPGDKIQLTYDRGGKSYTVNVTLKNNSGTTELVKADILQESLGAEFDVLDAASARKLGLSGGVRVKKIGEGALNDQTRMRDGFIITKVNGKDVKSLDDLRDAIGNSDQITISGVYPGYNEIFEYPIDLSGNE